MREVLLKKADEERDYLQSKLRELIKIIGPIPIANTRIMPFGWRKAAKGRTVWRIVEEIISQNLEKYAKQLGFERILSADSEVGVYDFEFIIKNNLISYVNIKSSVINGKPNKDDISKGVGLINFLKENIDKNLYVATFLIDFTEDMAVNLVDCIVFPVAWIPDVYINPSNNGNLQSKNYKNIHLAIKRTNEEFLDVLEEEMQVALAKKKAKKL